MAGGVVLETNHFIKAWIQIVEKSLVVPVDILGEQI